MWCKLFPPYESKGINKMNNCLFAVLTKVLNDQIKAIKLILGSL